MPSESSDLETSFDSDDTEMNSIDGYELEDEGHSSRVSPRSPETSSDSSDDDVAYTDEPMADAEWIKNYQEEMKANEELEQGLKDRLQGNVELKEWCKCGNCNVALLQNISESYCCCELEGCKESMKSDLVRQDLAPDVTLTCITEHPGFQPVCLQKWSLRLASDKFKTKGKKRYRQTGSKER
ncbi:uncharacterized protein [Acropora muricata]|uniref:uncharacterized protein n=1 Tax=Acropora muricata TaxID=159855 RepID=UPI0034E38D2D